MMPYFEYKLQQLTNFLGEKKLKQLGLLTCETCTHIMAHAKRIVVPSALSSRTYLTADELYDINKQFYNSTLPTSITSHLNFPKEVIGNSDVNSINNVAQVEMTNTVSETATLAEDSISTIASTKSSYSISSKTIEQLLAEILLDITTAYSPKDTNLCIGYIYNVYPSSPPHSLACTECNRLYAIAHPVLQLMPLPVRLTSTEYELLKGVYIDVLL